MIKGKILDHLKALCRHRRTLEEAARFKLFIKLEMNMRNSNIWAVLKKSFSHIPFHVDDALAGTFVLVSFFNTNVLCLFNNSLPGILALVDLPNAVVKVLLAILTWQN